jgi:hypothetical protein
MQSLLSEILMGIELIWVTKNSLKNAVFWYVIPCGSC